MDLEARARRLARLMEDRLDIGGNGFAAKLAKAGRRLPRHIRSEAEYLQQAIEMQDSPRLVRQIDHDRAERSFATVERYLLGVDAQAERTARALDWLAGNAFNLALVAALVAAIIVWRGLL